MACSPARSLASLLLSGAAACASPPPSPAPLIPLEAAGVGAVEIYGPGLVGTDDSGAAISFALTASASVVLVRVWPGQRLEQLYPLRSKDSTYFQTGWHTVHVPAPVNLAPVLAARRTPAAAPLPAVAQSQVDQCVWQEIRRRQPAPAPRTVSDSSRRARPAPAPTPLQIPPDYAAIEALCQRAVARPDAARLSSRDTSAAPLPDHYLVLVASDHAQDARHLTMRLGAVNIAESNLASVLQVLPGFLAGADATTWAGYVAAVSRH